MNLQEQIQRIHNIINIKEVVDVDDNSYVTMNIKNFPRYKKEISNLLQDNLVKSNGDFVKFKNSVVVGKDENGTPILSDDLKMDNRYLNYMISMGSKTFNSLLYSIFSDYYKVSPKTKLQQGVVNCDPTNFKIIGPIVAKDSKSLISYWVGQEGGKVYRIKLPEECLDQLTSDERNIYVTVEPHENRIHFPKGVPERLRGKKLGTLIYFAMIKKLGYITSSIANSAEIKMIYQDLISNPKYENDLMSLLLQKQVLIIDTDIKQDVVQIFKDFVSNKFTDKQSVKISPKLKQLLGDNFTNWYDTLNETSEQSIDDMMKKYEGEQPKNGDTVVDIKTGKIYSFNGEFTDEKGNKKIQLSSDKFEALLLSADEKPRFKVIHKTSN